MTYIYEKKNTGDLFHDLKAMGRSNFSYNGAQALMEFMEQMAEDTGEPWEYDAIALCCDFGEYEESEYEALAKEYDNAPKRADFEDSEDFKSALLEWLQDQTSVIEFDGGIIVQGF